VPFGVVDDEVFELVHGFLYWRRCHATQVVYLRQRRQAFFSAGLACDGASIYIPERMDHLFHPLIVRWFAGRFAEPTEPQRRGWPEIARARDTLIAAPTGTGKTLAAFLACLDRLVRQAEAGTLADRTQVVYVSPLKALGNDVQ